MYAPVSGLGPRQGLFLETISPMMLRSAARSCHAHSSHRHSAAVHAGPACHFLSVATFADRRGEKTVVLLEAHQRYFSYRAILVAIVSQKLLVLVFFGGIAYLSRDMLQNGVSHRCACVLSTMGEYRTILGSC